MSTETDPAPQAAQPATGEPPAFDEVRPLLASLADASLVDELKKAETAQKLIKLISERTSLHPFWVRPIYHWVLLTLAKKLEDKAKELIEAGTLKGLGWSARLLMRVPKIELATQVLMKLTDRLQADRDKARALRAFLDEGVALPEGFNFASPQEETGLRALDEVRQLKEDNKQIREDLFQIAKTLDRQPTLDLTIAPSGAEQRFVYRSRHDAFVGRENDLALLNGFLNDPEPLRWQLLTGQGGIGKSRLAFELCLANGGLWQAGFLPDGNLFKDWNHWTPSGPTLIVVDYVASRATDIADAIAALSIRKDKLEAPVRFLLLEREQSQTWWSDFRARRAQFGTHIQPNRYAEPYAVPTLSDDALTRLISNRVGAAKLDRYQFLEQLGAIDSQKRVLYALFLADSLAAGRDAHEWDMERLVEDVLDREQRDFWSEANDIDENLLAVATIAGGFDVTWLTKLKADQIPDGATYRPAVLASMSGGDGKNTVRKLEPDILGELFALRLLEPRHAADERGRALLGLSWLVDPVGLIDFRARAQNDFGGHEGLALIQKEKTSIASAIVTALIENVLAVHQQDGLNHLRRTLRYEAGIELRGVLLNIYSQLIDRAADHSIPISILLIQRGSEYRRSAEISNATADLSKVVPEEREKLWRYEQCYVWFLQGTTQTLSCARDMLLADLTGNPEPSSLGNRGLYAKVLERLGDLDTASQILSDLRQLGDDESADPDESRWARQNIPAHYQELTAALFCWDKAPRSALESAYRELLSFSERSESLFAFNKALQGAVLNEPETVRYWSQIIIDQLPQHVNDSGEQEATFHALLGASLEALGRSNEARQAYEQAIVLRQDLDNIRGISWAKQRLQANDPPPSDLLRHLIRHLYPIN